MMGYFSWVKASSHGSHANITSGETFKLLIPKEYGGGYLKGEYDGYGRLIDNDNNKSYDMYEILAFLNKEYCDSLFKNFKPYKLEYDGELTRLKTIDKYTDKNRMWGIEIGCYRNDIVKLPFPLKLVDISCNMTYEQCKNPSFNDPEQGMGILSWSTYYKYKKEGRF